MEKYFRYLIADARGNDIHWLQEDGEVLVQMHGHRSIIPFWSMYCLTVFLDSVSRMELIGDTLITSSDFAEDVKVPQHT